MLYIECGQYHQWMQQALVARQSDIYCRHSAAHEMHSHSDQVNSLRARPELPVVLLRVIRHLQGGSLLRLGYKVQRKNCSILNSLP